jgi:flagellar basal body rod protein FlgF
MSTGICSAAVTRTVEPDFAVGQIVHTGRELDVALTDPTGV